MPAAPGRLIEVDLVNGDLRETVLLGTTPGLPGDLKAELADDGNAAVLVDVPRRPWLRPI